MNNLDWYTKVTLFCKANQTCTECPFYLMQVQGTDIPFEEKLCFRSKETLERLSSWLADADQQDAEVMEFGEVADNQWLKDLLKGQFEEDEDDMDAFYMDDEFV